MPELNILQQAFRLRHNVADKREILELEKLIDPRVVRKVEGENTWEWRAKTDMGSARVPIFGFSNSLNETPKRWYPLRDSDPLTTVMTESELRDAAIMAVRGECYQQSRFPETVPPVDALILLLRIVKEDPDLIIAPWVDKAVDGEEIYFFLRDWEKSCQKNFAPRRSLPRFSV